MRASVLYCGPISRAEIDSNGTRLEPFRPLRDPVLRTPGAPFCTRMFGTSGCDEAFTLITDNCHAFTRYFAATLSPCINVGEAIRLITSRCRWSMELDPFSPL